MGDWELWDDGEGSVIFTGTEDQVRAGTWISGKLALLIGRRQRRHPLPGRRLLRVLQDYSGRRAGRAPLRPRPHRPVITKDWNPMTVTPAGLAYRHLPSFRREAGGLYAAWAAVYSRVHRARMTWLHRRGRHGPLTANRRCTWCGQKT